MRRAFADMGLAALKGERGPVYDRIVLNAGLTDYYLGLSANAEEGLAEAKRSYRQRPGAGSSGALYQPVAGGQLVSSICPVSR